MMHAVKLQAPRAVAARTAFVCAQNNDAAPAKISSPKKAQTKLLSTTLPDTFAALDLPAALVRWGHPGNMAVVLAAMGFYGAGYLGWAIRTSDDDDLVEKAKDLHPKLAVGMSIFFALGAVGGLLSLTMQGKPIFESPHVWTGITGLSLLGIQGMLSLFFEDDPNARGLHAYLGTGILALFVVHAGLGLKLGLGLGA